MDASRVPRAAPNWLRAVLLLEWLVMIGRDISTFTNRSSRPDVGGGHSARTLR